MHVPTTAQADFLEGWDAYQRGDYAAALKEWTKQAEMGDPICQYNVGVMYDEGTGVAPDAAKVIEWWGKAAAQEHRMAQHNLALLLIERGGEQNLRDAAGWLTHAAEAGFVPSQYTLAKIYASGIAVERDDARALALFERAGEAGFVKAQYNLGKIYRDGIGVEADPAVSFEWFNKAARQGYAKAQERLATRFALGDGVGRDVTEALKWAILAARQGYASAQDILDDLRKSMSKQQIAEAERRAAEFRTVAATRP